MEVNSDLVEISEKINREVYSDERITDLELEVKIETIEEIGIFKTEACEEKNNPEYLQIIGQKRKNNELLDTENKKIKEECILFEEFDYKQEVQETQDVNLSDLNNQVIYTK